MIETHQFGITADVNTGTVSIIHAFLHPTLLAKNREPRVIYLHLINSAAPLSLIHIPKTKIQC